MQLQLCHAQVSSICGALMRSNLDVSANKRCSVMASRNSRPTIGPQNANASVLYDSCEFKLTLRCLVSPCVRVFVRVCVRARACHSVYPTICAAPQSQVAGLAGSNAETPGRRQSNGFHSSSPSVAASGASDCRGSKPRERARTRHQRARESASRRAANTYLSSSPLSPLSPGRWQVLLPCSERQAARIARVCRCGAPTVGVSA